MAQYQRLSLMGCEGGPYGAGHWEGDLLVGHANASALGTLGRAHHAVYAVGAAEGQGRGHGAADVAGAAPPVAHV